jgi:hypothetical protein
VYVSVAVTSSSIPCSKIQNLFKAIETVSSSLRFSLVHLIVTFSTGSALANVSTHLPTVNQRKGKHLKLSFVFSFISVHYSLPPSLYLSTSLYLSPFMPLSFVFHYTFRSKSTDFVTSAQIRSTHFRRDLVACTLNPLSLSLSLQRVTVRLLSTSRRLPT